MTNENKKELFKWILVILGFTTVIFVSFLYLGDENMKENCMCLKILLTIFAILTCASMIIGIWFCKNNTCNLTCNIPNIEKGIVIVRHCNDCDYHCYYYDSIKSALEKVEDNDTLYVFEKNIYLSQNDIESIYQNNSKKKIVIQFVNNSQGSSITLEK